MNTQALIDGLIMFVAFIPIVTLHEWGHAWTAWKCGDPTAYNDGRVTLNPAAHIDPIGTVAMPLLMTVLGAFGGPMMIFGWGRPVPVVISNLRRGRIDDVLVSLAGPAMNIVLAVVVLAVAKLAYIPQWRLVVESAFEVAHLSVFLCFFNLLPIPPLDGGHVAKNLLGIRHETYARISQYSFIVLIIVVQLRPVQHFLHDITITTLRLLTRPLGL